MKKKGLETVSSKEKQILWDFLHKRNGMICDRVPAILILMWRHLFT